MIKTITVLEDDFDGGEASETIAFALDGVTYEVDVNDKNAKKLRGALQPFIEHARRTGGRKAQGVRGSRVFRDYDPKAVRRWAEANKIEVPARGRMPLTVVEQFKAAGN
jgi:hypothetical protein